MSAWYGLSVTRPRTRIWMLLGGTAITIVVVALLLFSCGSADSAVPRRAVYQDPAYSASERAADLVSRMTVEEKASQLVTSQAVAIPRLGVRAYGWWNEAAHGVAREQTNHGANPPDLVNTTIYPVSLSLASSWDPDLMYREATLISDEAREVVRDNALDLSFFSPTVNLGRDPRWGRNDETFGEDPYLTAAMASQFVNGMEGRDPEGKPLPEGAGYLKTATTLKHYAANNSEVNRLDGSSDVDQASLREYYTAQFRDIVARSSPASIMSAYNRVNGEPAAASPFLMNTLARRTYGFSGYFVSDCDAVFMIQKGHAWQPPWAEAPLDEVDRNAAALVAGEDLNCNMGYHDASSYATALPAALHRGFTTPQGTLTEHDLDAALVRLFTARIRLGEFDDPQDVPWIAQARSRVPRGSWESSDANEAVTQTPERLAMAREAGARSLVLLKNEKVGGEKVSGESKVSGDGEERARPLLPLRVPASGAYHVAVVGPSADLAEGFFGGYSSIQKDAARKRTVTPCAGITAAVTKLNPGARVDCLPGTISGGQEVDRAALAAVRDADVVVIHAATNREVADEASDRPSMDLPDGQAELIEAVADLNPRTVVALETIGPMDLRRVEPRVPALLWSSYNGQRHGESLADVLLGEVNPSGHLPFTWYAGTHQLPEITDYRLAGDGERPGRTYLYFHGEPTYPFGHGLGYTTFRHSGLTVERSTVAPADAVEVEVTVTNTGDVAGRDAVQLYVTSPKASDGRERPIARLRRFQQVEVDPGQSETVTFTLPVTELAFYDEKAGRFQVDAGRYELRVGTSAATDDVEQKASFTVKGTWKPRPAVLSVTPRRSGDPTKVISPRISYPVGVTVEPRPTVALEDQRLLGFTDATVDPPLPAELRVTYRSNRPEVVEVDRAGTLRTKGAGVATVTASLTAAGRTLTEDFVIRVEG